MEVFVCNTNLTFLAFLCKEEGFYKVSTKLPPVGIELTTLTITGLKSDAYPTLLICHALPVPDCQTLTKSCSIESRNDPSPKKGKVVHEKKTVKDMSYSTHVWLAEWDKHLTSNPLMVSVVSSIPTWGNFILVKLFKIP